jgi:hypothetical protein
VAVIESKLGAAQPIAYCSLLVVTLDLEN